jgi:hypothetical protein
MVELQENHGYVFRRGSRVPSSIAYATLRDNHQPTHIIAEAGLHYPVEIVTGWK